MKLAGGVPCAKGKCRVAWASAFGSETLGKALVRFEPRRERFERTALSHVARSTAELPMLVATSR